MLFVKNIIEWYRKYGDHNLPWRRTKNPWEVLVGAIMLRKTTTKQVLKVYPAFISKFRTPKDVYLASNFELRKILTPLGIEHQRTMLLKHLARTLVEKFEGKVPKNKHELMKLPGVKQYVASEVLCIAYGVPEPLLDRNMIRVLERVFGKRAKRRRPHLDPDLWHYAKRLVPRVPELAKEYNWGILDFARKICKARNPKCSICPMRSFCTFVNKGLNNRS